MTPDDAATLPGAAADPRTAVLARLYDLGLVVVAATAVILSIWLLSEILVVIFAACLLAVIFHGTSGLLERKLHLPHWAALTLVVLVTAVLLVGLAVSAGPGLVDQANQLQQALRQQLNGLHDRLAGTGWGRALLQKVPTQMGGEGKDASFAMPSDLAGSVFGVVNSVFGLLGSFAVVAIASLYLAASPQIYLNGTLRLVPPRHRAKAKELTLAAGQALWAWSAGQALDMVVVGLLSGIGLWLIGVPLALVLGVVAGLLNFVPYIGAIVGAIPAVIIAFSVGSTVGLETIALYLVIQGFEGNVMAPLIQKQAVHMPPGLTILSQTAFGVILGIPGLVFATPLTAALLAVGDKATAPLASPDAAGADSR